MRMNCPTFHYDNARTGLLLRSNPLQQRRADGRAWGKYQELDLGAPVRGAPLYLPDWTIQHGGHARQTHTMVYVATSANQVFAFAEDQLMAGGTGHIWQTGLDNPNRRSGSNIPPPVGVCSTMVLEELKRRLFVAAMVDDGHGGSQYKIYSLDLDTGAILAQAPIIDQGGNGPPVFLGQDHDQRGALLLAGDEVFVTFADFLADDNGPYRGWLVGCKTDNLSDQRFIAMGSRSTFGGGIWGPGGASADARNHVYVVTGNSVTADDGYWDHLGSRHPADLGDFFEAVVRVDPTQSAVSGNWTDIHNPAFAVPGWFGNENQGGGVAIADINGNGRPDLIVFHIDNPSGENHGYYRIGWNLDAAGRVTGGWSNPIQIPGWFGSENQGGGIAVADVNGNGRPDLIVFHIDHPSNGNHGYYRIGWNLDATGHVTGGWSNPIQIPGWFGNENQGGGIAVADVNGNGRPDLIVFHIDHPSNGNHGYYRIGWNLDTTGHVTGGWSNPTQIPGWFGNENQGGGIAVGDVDGDGSQDLVAFHIDHPANGNHGYYRVGWKLDALGNVAGGWGNPAQVPGWFGNEDQAGAVALANINGTGSPDLVVFHIDHPSNGNHGYYRVGFDLHPTPALVAADWYAPGDTQSLNADDKDLGGASALLVPPGDGKKFVVTGDKKGHVYLLDSSNLGHWAGEVQRIQPFNGEVRCGPAYYHAANGDHIVYLSGHGKPGLAAFRLKLMEGRARLEELWQAKDRSGQVVALNNAAGSPVVVSTPGTDRIGELPIVWVLDGGDDEPMAALRAFNALDGTELFNSLRNPRDRCAELPHYPPMSCSENSVFVGTNNGLACYRSPTLSAQPAPDFVVFHLDHPSGGNHGYVRLTSELGSDPVWGPPTQIPGWFGNENQGGGVAVADVNGNGRPDLIVFHIDNPSGENHGYYRIGWNLDAAGRVTGGWSNPIQIPGWFGNENQGGGIAVADVNGNGRPDLIVFHIDHPSNGNHGYYRIGWNLDPAGNVTGGWSNPVQIPGWFGNENQGGGIAVADVNGNGRPDLIVFHIDNPSGENHGYYRVGWNLDTAGNVTAGWSNPTEIPGWFGSENQGGGVAVGDIDGDGSLDLVVFHIDHPSNGNHGYYRVGWKLGAGGNVLGGWTDPIQVPGWFGNENQAGSIAIGSFPFSWSWPDSSSLTH